MIGIDLFSGAGGMSLGAKQAGVDVQLAVEADQYAAETYLSNFSPKLGLYQDDIRNFKKVPLKSKGCETILFGGPPCQGFSTSNQKHRSYKNLDNWLLEEFVRVTEMYEPDWVIFENVKGILETEKGFFAKLVTLKLELLGYKTNAKILNAADFGVPQTRSRYFVVGSRSKKFKFPTSLADAHTTVGEAISDLPCLKNGASQCYLEYQVNASTRYANMLRTKGDGCFNHLVTKNSELIIERYKHVRQGSNWEDIPSTLMSNYTDRSRCHTGIYRRLRGDRPSVVIGNYRKNMLIHPTQDRGLSVREAARLQSFPDWFKFRGSIGFQQQQVGNAVPPLLAKAIFSSIISQA